MAKENHKNDELLDYIYDEIYDYREKAKTMFDEIDGLLDQIETNIAVKLDDAPFGWYSDSIEYYLDGIEKELHRADEDFKTVHKKINKMANDFE